MSELWAAVWDCPLYEVSTLGQVRRASPGKGTHAGRALRTHPDRKGYLRVKMRADGRQITNGVHVLVAEAFLGRRPLGLQVNHRDGVKSHNTLDNLEWVTGKDNMHHAVAHGLRADFSGELHPGAKLNESQVREIRDLEGLVPQRQIARQFSVARTLVQRIHQRRAWAHLPESSWPMIERVLA